MQSRCNFTQWLKLLNRPPYPNLLKKIADERITASVDNMVKISIRKKQWLNCRFQFEACKKKINLLYDFRGNFLWSKVKIGLKYLGNAGNRTQNLWFTNLVWIKRCIWGNCTQRRPHSNSSVFPPVLPKDALCPSAFPGLTAARLTSVCSARPRLIGSCCSTFCLLCWSYLIEWLRRVNFVSTRQSEAGNIVRHLRRITHSKSV